MLKTPEDQFFGNDRFEGFCIDLLNEIANIVKFSFKIYLVPDGKYGTLDKGEWSGLVKELLDKVRVFILRCFSLISCHWSIQLAFINEMLHVKFYNNYYIGL